MNRAIAIPVGVAGGSAFIALLVLGLIAFLVTDRDVRYEVLQVSGSRNIEIIRNSFADPSFMFSYRVHDGENEVAPSCFIQAKEQVPPKPFYRLVSGPASNLVGVVSRSAPEVIVAMHDFSSGESWPYPGGMSDGRGREMLSRLRDDTGLDALRLPR